MFCRHLIFNIFLFVLISSTAHAQSIKRLNSIAYNVNEGLLQSRVSDINQDGAGFIWVSTGGGVQRFDGRNFYHIPVINNNKGIPDDRFVGFFKLRNGNLWLNHQKGISEYNINTNRFKTVLEINTSSGPQKTFYEDDTGVWCWFEKKGFYRIDKETHHFTDSIKSLAPKPFDGSNSSGLISTGKYFVRFWPEAIMITDRSSRLERFIPATTGKRHFFTIENFKEDSILVATVKGIEKLDCKSGKLVLVTPYKTIPLSINIVHPVQIRLISNSTCLVSEGNKLFELDITRGIYTAHLMSLQNKVFPEVGYITGIFTDSHQNIWVISENNGIRKVNYRFAGFKYFGTDSRKNNFVKTIYVDKDDNRLLCGTFGEGLMVFDTSQQLLKTIQDFPGVKGPYTVCAFRRTDPHRYLVLLMGVWNVFLLNTETFTVSKLKVETDQIRKQVNFHIPDYHLSLFPINDTASILQSSFYINKMIWKAPDKITYLTMDTIQHASISSMIDHDRVWVGSYGKFYLSGPGFTKFNTFNLRENKLVRSFCNSSTGGVWMGTEKGLYLLDKDGKVEKEIGKSDGLLDENIYALRMDKNGNLWMSHNKGLSCRKTDGSLLHFSRNDGLQENEFNTNTSFETADGELFFGGVNGISSFYPQSVTSIRESPSVLLTGIRIRNMLWKEDTAYWSIPKIELPHSNNNISFSLTAIGNRSAEQYNYQYQLSGVDAQWVNAGNNPEVRYVLPPGRYVFRYYAGNSFEKDPPDTRELIVIVHAPFWKRGWFIASAIAFLLLTIILITRYISQRKLKRMIGELEQKRMMDEERLRISQEMHDDIGAGLTQITMMSEAAKNSTNRNEPLSEIADTSRKLVSSMSEIIWSMHPENNTLDRLLGYLREELSKLLEYSGMAYEINFPEDGNTIFLNNSQRRNLYLVSKEIVHNAIKHSQAKKISIECEIKDRQLHFVVRDDGRGFDTLSKYSGNGLRNIKRRIEELNGSLQITSSGNGSQFSYNTILN